ncbi:hypothetical protein EPN87_03375, partial [archaeon]
MIRKLVLAVMFLLLLPAAFAQTQSHPLSQITPINANLDMFSYNVTNASFVLYNDGIVAAGTRGIPTADIQSSAVTGAKISAGVVTSSKLSNPLGGSMNASAYYDSDNSAYYLDPAGTGTSLAVAGWINGSALNISGVAYIQGNVGIGTTSPETKLDIYGTLQIENTGAETAFYSTNNYPRLYSSQSGGSYPFGENGNLIIQPRTSSGGRDIVFATGGTPATKMVIDRNGKVGVNTSSPQNTLNVLGDINATGTIYGTVSGTISGNATGLTCTGCVGTNELASSAVTSSKLANGAVGSTQLANPIGGSINATMYYDSDNSAYYLDPAGATSLLTAGNVGIGTTGPITKLDIVGSGSAFPATSGTTQSAGHIARFKDNSNLVLDIGGNLGNGFWLQSTDKTNLATNYPLLLNPNGGNVGIGTTNPGSRLVILGDESFSPLVVNNSLNHQATGIKLVNPNTAHGWWLALGGNGADANFPSGQFNIVEETIGIRFTIQNSTGNVGIGTTSPQNKLNVIGDINATGTITGTIGTNAVVGSSISAGAISSSKLANPLGGSVNATMYYDSDNSNYYLDPAATGFSQVVAGYIRTEGGLAISSNGDYIANTIYGPRGADLNISSSADGSTARGINIMSPTGTGAGPALSGLANRLRIGTGAAQGSGSITSYEPIVFSGNSIPSNPTTTRIGQDSANSLVFASGYTSTSSAFRFFNQTGNEILDIGPKGNVGIGITSMFARLDVREPTPGLTWSADFLNTNYEGIFIGHTGTASQYSLPQNTTFISADYLSGGTESGQMRPIAFVTNNAGRMLINTAGNVGIGTVTPNVRLEVANGGFNVL